MGRKIKISLSLNEGDVEYLRGLSNHLGGTTMSETVRYIIQERRMMHEEPWLILPPPDKYVRMIRGGAGGRQA
jgi:hypothetical protein